MKEVKLKNGQIMFISQADLEDAKQYTQYINEVTKQTKFINLDELDGEVNLESTCKWFESCLGSDKKFIFLAKIDCKIVGCGNISPIAKYVRLKHRCEMGISVLKDYWNLGIASEIMNVLVDVAKNAKYEQIELQVVEENICAIHLYKKFGFYETGYINNAMKYADNSYAKFILMQKDL